MPVEGKLGQLREQLNKVEQVIVQQNTTAGYTETENKAVATYWAAEQGSGMIVLWNTAARSNRLTDRLIENNSWETKKENDMVTVWKAA